MKPENSVFYLEEENIDITVYPEVRPRVEKRRIKLPEGEKLRVGDKTLVNGLIFPRELAELCPDHENTPERTALADESLDFLSNVKLGLNSERKLQLLELYKKNPILDEDKKTYKALLDDIRLAVPGKIEIVVGDLYGNFLKFLYVLIREGAISGITKENWARLVEISKIPSSERQTIQQKFEVIINKITIDVDPESISLFGNVAGGTLDFRFLLLFKKVAPAIKEILCSDHDVGLLEEYAALKKEKVAILTDFECEEIKYARAELKICQQFLEQQNALNQSYQTLLDELSKLREFQHVKSFETLSLTSVVSVVTNIKTNVQAAFVNKTIEAQIKDKERLLEEKKTEIKSLASNINTYCTDQGYENLKAALQSRTTRIADYEKFKKAVENLNQLEAALKKLLQQASEANQNTHDVSVFLDTCRKFRNFVATMTPKFALYLNRQPKVNESMSQSTIGLAWIQECIQNIVALLDPCDVLFAPPFYNIPENFSGCVIRKEGKTIKLYSYEQNKGLIPLNVVDEKQLSNFLDVTYKSFDYKELPGQHQERQLSEDERVIIGVYTDLSHSPNNILIAPPFYNIPVDFPFGYIIRKEDNHIKLFFRQENKQPICLFALSEAEAQDFNAFLAERYEESQYGESSKKYKVIPLSDEDRCKIRRWTGHSAFQQSSSRYDLWGQLRENLLTTEILESWTECYLSKVHVVSHFDGVNEHGEKAVVLKSHVPVAPDAVVRMLAHGNQVANNNLSAVREKMKQMEVLQVEPENIVIFDANAPQYRLPIEVSQDAVENKNIHCFYSYDLCFYANTFAELLVEQADVLVKKADEMELRWIWNQDNRDGAAVARQLASKLYEQAQVCRKLESDQYQQFSTIKQNCKIALNQAKNSELGNFRDFWSGLFKKIGEACNDVWSNIKRGCSCTTNAVETVVPTPVEAVVPPPISVTACKSSWFSWSVPDSVSKIQHAIDAIEQHKLCPAAPAA